MPFKRTTVQSQTRPTGQITRLQTALDALHAATITAVDSFASAVANPLPT